MPRLLARLVALILIGLPLSLFAQEAQTDPTPEVEPRAEVETEGPMTARRLVDILMTLDPEAAPVGPALNVTISDVPVLVFMDPMADRMRAMVPVASMEGLSDDDMLRVLQANFDTALDARYAVGNGRLWSVYLHPLSELSREELISGLAQTVILARTYGTSYASGLQIFGSGDSDDRYQDLIDELRERGEAL